MGWKVVACEGGDAAVPFFTHAVEIDPRFAAAYASLGLMYGSMGETELGTENAKKAYQLRDRASDNGSDSLPDRQRGLDDRESDGWRRALSLEKLVGIPERVDGQLNG